MLDSVTTEIFDLIIAVDIVTQIIVNLYDNAEKDYFTWISNHLSSNGYVLFELQSFSNEIDYIKKERKPYSWWEEFPLDDPFQYGLYSMILDQDENIVYKKLFYERRTKEFSGFKDVITPYPVEAFLKKLKQYDMEGEVYYSYREPGDLDKKLYLVLARKRGK